MLSSEVNPMNVTAAKGRSISPISSDRIFTKAKPLSPPLATFTVSARGKPPEQPIFAYLRDQYGNLQLREIESLFGFVEACTLYGGRAYKKRELSDRDVRQLNNSGIGLRIPMSNHKVSAGEYEQYLPLFDKYHRAGNSIISTNDDLARWVRRDFPDYKLDASVIKNINTHRKIDQALKLYDTVVLPMRANEDLAFLQEISEKDRIVLFANAGCALTCPSHLCYPSFSKMNKFQGGEFRCSQPLKDRDMLGMVDFPLQRYIDLGYHQFKLLRARPGNVTGF